MENLKYLMEIKILGPGCPNCKTLEKLTRSVVAEKGITANIIKVEDIMDIMNHGIMSTPALIIDGKIAVKGRVPSATEIGEFLTK